MKTKVSMSENKGRRSFLLTLGWGFIGLAFAGLVRIVGRFLSASRGGPGLGPVIFGPPADYAEGGATVKDRVVLFHDKSGFWAVSAVCPHLGCQPAFQQEQNGFVCPCHGSRFDPDGRLLAGPAEKGMTLASLRLDSQGKLVAYPGTAAQPGQRLIP
jgi:cytochrome b6-f complex iron-sulfur subunit